jgi:murein DD-endopeptidase MepM/ murein hydrolase activator NlpD
VSALHRHRRPLLSPRARLLLGILGLLGIAGLAGCEVTPAPRGESRYEILLHTELPKLLAVPVEGVSAAKLVDSWGDGRDGGRGHQGIDIFARRGTPVRSVTEGVIDAKDLHGLGGRIVDIVGPAGYRHYYAHLEDWAGQKKGDWVVPGEVIGYVGDSGNAAWKGTHLHYCIYTPEGQAIDPYPYLTGKRGRG